MSDIQRRSPPAHEPRYGGALRALREGNLQRILVAIRNDGGLSQAEVARRTALSPATVSNLVAELKRRGLVRRGERRSDGRTGLEVVIGRASNVVLGVDFGHRHVRVGVAGLNGKLLADEQRLLPLDLGVTESCAEAWAMAERLLAAAGARAADVLHVGVGLPGPIDPVSGRVGWGAILQRWEGLEARSTLREAFGLPVSVENDGNLGALGELHHGAGRGCTDFVYLNLATGVGAGLIIDGRLHRGAAGTAAEIGHITIDPQGPLCRCGNRGCLETMIGSRGILDTLSPSYGQVLDMPAVLRLAEGGDARCRRALAEAGRAVGVVVADLCNLLSPQRIVVAGDLARAGELVLSPLRAMVAERAVPAAARAAEIVPSPLGDRSEMLGAIQLAVDALRGQLTDALVTPTASGR
jgi:predicted NBD/HSP70 family sugar kinase